MSTTDSHTFAVRTTDGTDHSVAGAAYYVIDDGFCTFKNGQHEQLASFTVHQLVSVIRS